MPIPGLCYYAKPSFDMIERAGFRADVVRGLCLAAEQKVARIFGGDGEKSDLVIALVQSTILRKFLTPITAPLKLYLSYHIVCNVLPPPG